MAVLGLRGLALALALEPASLPGGGALEWSAPAAACPDAAHVVELLREHTGDAETATRVQANARASEQPDGTWSIALELAAADGEATQRTFAVATCEAGAQAVALALAIALTPEHPDETPSADPEPAVVPEPTPQPSVIESDVEPGDRPAAPVSTFSDSKPADAPKKRQSPRVRARIGVAGGVTGGVLPRAGGLVIGYVGVIGDMFHIAARFEHETRRAFALEDRPPARGLISSYGAALEGGHLFRVGPIEIPLHVGVSAAGLRARGDRVPVERTKVVPWVGLLAGAGVQWAPIRRLAIGVRGEVVAGLLRHTFAFSPGFPLLTTGWVGGRGFGFIEVRLP